MSCVTSVGNKAGKLLGIAGKAALPLAMIGGAISIGTTLADDTINADDKAKSIGNSAGGMSGVLAGAAAGATIGSVVPIIGTTIGGLIGSIVGGFGGSWIGEKIGDAVISDSNPIEKSLVRTQKTDSKTTAMSSNNTITLNYTPIIHQQPGENAEQLSYRIKGDIRDELERMMAHLNNRSLLDSAS